MDYVQRITDLRNDNDLNQKEIAALLHTKQSVISKYEKGRLKYNIDQIIALAKYYQVSTDYLLGLTDDPKGSWLKK